MHDSFRYRVVTPEEEIYLAALGGDRNAFSRLVADNQSAVRSFARRISAGNHARADDLAQDAFVAAWSKLASWSQRGKFSSWVKGIVWNLFLEEERKGKRRRELAEKQPEDIQAVMPGSDIRLDLERALAMLKPVESAAISLCLRDGLTIREAALLLEMPEGTVKSHISRGRAALKTILSGATQGQEE